MMPPVRPGEMGNEEPSTENGMDESSTVAGTAAGRGHNSNIGRLLDREAPPDYIREWTDRVAAEKSRAEIGTKSVLVFRVGDEWLALPTGSIHEVAECLTVHTIPHRRSGVLLGLVSFRGELWLCVSLRAVLGIEVGLDNEAQRVYDRVVLIGEGANRLAFPVDEVLGVRRFHPGELEEPPATLSGAKSRYTEGLLLDEKKAIGCIDDELLFYGINKSLS